MGKQEDKWCSSGGQGLLIGAHRATVTRLSSAFGGGPAPAGAAVPRVDVTAVSHLHK